MFDQNKGCLRQTFIKLAGGITGVQVRDDVAKAVASDVENRLTAIIKVCSDFTSSHDCLSSHQLLCVYPSPIECHSVYAINKPGYSIGGRRE
jgi:hypothetical protein